MNCIVGHSKRESQPGDLAADYPF